MKAYKLKVRLKKKSNKNRKIENNLHPKKK